MDDKIELIRDSDLKESENVAKIYRSPSSLISRKGLSVTWKNLSVVAETNKNGLFKETKKTCKQIIRNVDGVVQAGTLVAILGASGSGKSTLMSALANRNADGVNVKGDIRIGGKRIGNFTKYVSGFVYQDDLFIASLTVMEHLHFAAKLKMSQSTSSKARHNLICDVLSELGLSHLANNRIGNTNYGNDKISLSGGERKRLSVATELLTDPALLFCDEPTTGLDSFTALTVVTNLKYLASHRQKTIICSIHQPNDKIFGLFHEIILLANGRIAFSGTTEDAIEFFKFQGFPYLNQNAADYLIKNVARVSDGATRTTEKLCLEYRKSSYAKKVESLIEVENQKQYQNSLSFWCNRIDVPSWGHKLLYSTHRNYLSIRRDPAAQYLKIFQKFILGLVIGLCMRGTVHRTQYGMQALKGIIFMIVSQNFFPAVHVSMVHIPKLLPIFQREYANNSTTPGIFYLSTIIPLGSYLDFLMKGFSNAKCLKYMEERGEADPSIISMTLPGFALDATAVTLSIYVMAALDPNFDVILLSCIITILTNNASCAFGIFMSTLIKKRELANAFTIPVDQLYMVCSGIFIKLSTVPVVLRWIRYISWVAYAVEALFIVQLTNIKVIECSKRSEIPCLQNSTEVLASYDFKEEDLYPNMFRILCICLVFHLGSYYLLRRNVRL